MQPAGGTRIQGLDVLRGVAVGLVLVRHAFPTALPGGGIVGVTIFFVLSGYLITGIVLRDIARTGRFSAWTFYRNRTVRLLPALLFFLAVFALVTVVVDPLEQAGRLRATLVLALTYTADLPLGLAMHEGTSHLWTLAVEEQFYLIWPLLLLLGVRRGRVGLLVMGTVVVLLAVAALSVAVYWENPVRVYQWPTTWAAALALGAAARLLDPRLRRWSAGPWGAPAAGVAALVLAACCFVPDAKHLPITYLLGTPLIAVSSIVVVGYLSGWVALPTRLLVPVRWLGTVSYAAYLWNLLIVVWVIGLDREVLFWQSALTVPLTVAAAAVSWWLVERPASRRWRVGARVVAAADPVPTGVAHGAADPVGDVPSKSRSLKSAAASLT
jgi:peptidoglycan/LPS O-acetylase OafA/YrhL